MAALIGRGNLGSSVARSDARDAKSQRLAELHALLARVEAATGPDRELDGALGFELLLRHEGDFSFEGFSAGGVTYRDQRHRLVDLHWAPPMYTASLDAALALVERVLPGWGCVVTLPLGGDGYAQVFDKTGREYDRHGQIGALSEWLDAGPCHSPTPTLALLSALLQALSADTASPTAGTDRTRDEPKSEPDQ